MLLRTVDDINKVFFSFIIIINTFAEYFKNIILTNNIFSEISFKSITIQYARSIRGIVDRSVCKLHKGVTLAEQSPPWSKFQPGKGEGSEVERRFDLILMYTQTKVYKGDGARSELLIVFLHFL